MPRRGPKSVEVTHPQEEVVEEKEDVEQIVADDEDGSEGDSNDLEEEDERVFDGLELVTGLFVGGEGCAYDHEGRKGHGITHVLSIVSKFEQGFRPDPKMVTNGRWKIYDREDRPTADVLNILDSCVDFINDCLGSRGKICIHSLEGKSRSVTVCIAYLIKTLGMTLKSAHDLVSNLCEDTRINRGFWRQLLAYEQTIRGCTSMMEEELPGTVMFEQEELDEIIRKFHFGAGMTPMSPTGETRLGLEALGLGSPLTKRKHFEWPMEAPQEPNLKTQRRKELA